MPYSEWPYNELLHFTMLKTRGQSNLTKDRIAVRTNHADVYNEKRLI